MKHDPITLLRRALVSIEDPRESNQWGSDEKKKLAADIRKTLKGVGDGTQRDTRSA